MTDYATQFAIGLRAHLVDHRLGRWGRPGRVRLSQFAAGVTEDARKWAEAEAGDALRRARDDHAATVRQLAATQAEVGDLRKQLADIEAAGQAAIRAEVSVSRAHETTLAAYRAENDRLQAELAEEQAAHAAANAHALHVGRILKAEQEGQGAAPEPPPVAPLPVRKPRTRKPAGGAQ